MIGKPEDYGAGLGADSIILPEQLTIHLKTSGVDLSVSAKDLPEGESPSAINVRIDGRGISHDRGMGLLGNEYTNPEDRYVLNVYPYQQSNLRTILMRQRSTGWDRYNGSTWKTITGNFTGTQNDRWTNTVYRDKMIGANGVDRLQVWDGSDASTISDLSADAPRAKYICRIGQRIMAAYIKLDTGIDPNLVAWCGNGDETEWTDINAGAGIADLLPEGPSPSADNIRGLSTLAEAGVIYRQRSIVLAQLTGVGIAPFRFTTTNFNHGTESPYSIASGGPLVGDFYLGHDGLVRLFDGSNSPVPIGLPITENLLASIYDYSKVIGAVDTHRMEYWLGIPTDSTGLIKQAWVFSIYEYLRSNKLSWRKRIFTENPSTISFGPVPAYTDPIVNTKNDPVKDIVNLDNRRVNSLANNASRDVMLFGSNVGGVLFTDETIALQGGIWDSQTFWDEGDERTVQEVRLVHNTQIPSTIEVSISVDAGLTWRNPQVFNLPITGRGSIASMRKFSITGRLFQLRMRFLSGLTTISEIRCVAINRGRGIS